LSTRLWMTILIVKFLIFLASGKDFMTKYLNYLTVAPVV
jgi:hypothetical protein